MFLSYHNITKRREGCDYVQFSSFQLFFFSFSIWCYLFVESFSITGNFLSYHNITKRREGCDYVLFSSFQLSFFSFLIWCYLFVEIFSTTRNFLSLLQFTVLKVFKVLLEPVAIAAILVLDVNYFIYKPNISERNAIFEIFEIEILLHRKTAPF